MERILLVVDNLEFGGGERVFLQLAAGLRNRFEFFFASMQGGELELRLRELGIRLFRVDMNRSLSWRPITQIRDIIRQNEINLIHSQGARADFFARLAGRVAPAPYILSTVAMPVEGFDVRPLRKRIYRLLDQLSGHFVERFIVVSDSLKKTLTEQRRIPQQRVIRIYNGIELDQYHPDFKETSPRNQWDIPHTVPLIGAIGRMVWQKGFEYLIKAVPEILKLAPEATFLLIGEGPLRPDLEHLTKELKVHDRVIFAGYRSDIQNLLSTIDILVAPSLLEGFPMITLEAMAMEKPIVATRINGIEEQILDGQEGLLVHPKNPKLLAAAVSRIINDTELSSKLGKAARRKVESCFSVEKMVKETEQVYLSLLKAN